MPPSLVFIIITNPTLQNLLSYNRTSQGDSSTAPPSQDTTATLHTSVVLQFILSPSHFPRPLNTGAPILRHGDRRRSPDWVILIATATLKRILWLLFSVNFFSDCGQGRRSRIFYQFSSLPFSECFLSQSPFPFATSTSYVVLGHRSTRKEANMTSSYYH